MIYRIIYTYKSSRDKYNKKYDFDSYDDCMKFLNNKIASIRFTHYIKYDRSVKFITRNSVIHIFKMEIYEDNLVEEC